MGFIGSWLSTAIATAVAIWVVPGIEAVGGSWAAPIFTALVLVLAALCLPAGRSEAAGLQDADFSYRKTKIRESEAELIKAWGEPIRA